MSKQTKLNLLTISNIINKYGMFYLHRTKNI